MLLLPAVGELVANRYELSSILGEGGYGRVYLAVDKRDGRRVALKVSLSEEHQDRQRFARERRVLHQLRSPHIARLLDFGVDEELPFTVFELVEGEDMSTALGSRGRFDEGATRAVLRQMLLALDEAHRAGVVHRDLKPENIRGTWEGTPSVKLLDFGIARPTDEHRMPVTRTGELVGTPRYMSPEQLLGKPLGPASDIYCLGVVAYEMLVGREAVHGHGWGDQLDRLQSGHLFGLPESVDATATLGQIIARMCAVRPEHRYASAAAVLRALDGPPAQTAPQPVEAAPTPPNQTSPLVIIAVALLLVCGVLAAVANKMNDEGTTPPTPAQRQDLPGLVKSEERPQLEAVSPTIQDAGSDAHGNGSGCGKPQESGHRELQVPASLVGKPTVAYIPTGYDPEKPHPIVFLFHTDQDGGAPSVVSNLGMDKLADEHGIIVIAPRGGIDIAWKNPGDVDSADKDYENAMGSLCIDRDRVYAVGHGNGGRAVGWFLCRHPDVAAIATTAWVREKEFPWCEEYRAVPTIHFATLRSRYTPPQGGGQFDECLSPYDKISLKQFEAELVKLHDCASTAPTQLKKADATCFTWDCAEPLTSCHVDAGGLWPGAPNRNGLLPGLWERCDGPRARLDYGAEIWSFFESVAPRAEAP